MLQQQQQLTLKRRFEARGAVPPPSAAPPREGKKCSKCHSAAFSRAHVKLVSAQPGFLLPATDLQRIPKGRPVRHVLRSCVCVCYPCFTFGLAVRHPGVSQCFQFLSCYFSRRAKKERRQRFICYITSLSLWAKIKLSQSRIIYNRSTCLSFFSFFPSELLNGLPTSSARRSQSRPLSNVTFSQADIIFTRLQQPRFFLPSSFFFFCHLVRRQKQFALTTFCIYYLSQTVA